MKEFCKKEIEFTVIKLNNSVNKMIEVMRDNHQELEVTDMSTKEMEDATPEEMSAKFKEEAASGCVKAVKMKCAMKKGKC